MDEIQTIHCEYKDVMWSNGHNLYTCYIKNQAFDRSQKYQFDTTNCRNIDEIVGIQIWDSQMNKIPENFPWNRFPNLQYLLISFAFLRDIRREDLQGLENVKELYLSYNYLEYLPADLFSDFKCLERLVLDNNYLKYIEPGLVDSLMMLSYLDLGRNSNIDMFYDKNGICNATMEDIREQILKSCEVTDRNREKFNPRSES